MQAYRVETALQKNGTLTLDHLPFQAGEPVEIIILSRSEEPEQLRSYSLRGTPVQYVHPFEPVAQEDWEATE